MRILILILITLLIIIVLLGRRAEKIRPPERVKTPATIVSPVTQPESGIEETAFEEKIFTIEEIRQKQLEHLREKVHTKDSTSRPGKYPTKKELEEIENSGAIVY